MRKAETSLKPADVVPSSPLPEGVDRTSRVAHPQGVGPTVTTVVDRSIDDARAEGVDDILTEGVDRTLCDPRITYVDPTVAPVVDRVSADTRPSCVDDTIPEGVDRTRGDPRYKAVGPTLTPVVGRGQRGNRRWIADDSLTDRAVRRERDARAQIDGAPARAVKSRIDRNQNDARMGLVDLDSLHEQMVHYARMYWDVQQTRVQVNNRYKALERDLIERGLGHLIAQFGSPLKAALGECQLAEGRLERGLTKLAKQHPMAAFVEQTVGLGYPGLALLIGVTGPLDQFPTVSKLWKYLGLDVNANGVAPSRVRGQKLGYSPRGRTLCFQLSEVMMKNRKSVYRELYDRKKGEYQEREPQGPSGCVFGKVHYSKEGVIVPCPDGHIHMAALRYEVKALIRDLWVAWHRMVVR